MTSISGRRALTWLLRGVALVLAGWLIGFYARNLHFLSERAADIVMLSRLEVVLAPGARQTIGRLELMQSGEGGDTAELQHVELKNTGGAVTLRNVARQHRAFLYYPDRPTYSARWKLAAGDVLSVGGVQMAVTGASPNELSFGVGARKFNIVRTSTDATTTMNKAAVDICKAMEPLEEVQDLFARLFAAGEGRTVAFLGGQIDCRIAGPVHVSMPGVPWRGLAILERKDGWYLAPGDPAGFPSPAFKMARTLRTIQGFDELDWPVTAEAGAEPPGGLQRITIGRTTYAVTTSTEGVAGKTVRVAFVPEKRVHRLPVDESVVVPQGEGACPEPKPAAPKRPGAAAEKIEPDEVFLWKAPAGVVRRCTPVHRVMSFPRDSAAVRWLDSPMERALRWAIIAISAALAALVLIEMVRTGIAFSGWRRWVGPSVAMSILAVVFAAALSPELASWLGYDLGLKQALLINAAAWYGASIAVFVYGGVGLASGLAWFGFAGLVLLGTLVQHSLALDAPTTRWVIQIQKHKLLFLDLAPLATVLVMLAPYERMVTVVRTFVADRTTAGMLCRTLPAYILLGGMLYWFFRGNQQGVEGFQPVEFGKVAVVAILALLAVGLERIQLLAFGRSRRSLLVLMIAAGGPLLAGSVAAWYLGTAGITSLYVVALSHGYLSAGVLFAVVIGLGVLLFMGRADYGAWVALTGATLFIFGSAMLLVPVLKKDFSPILIMMVVTVVICAVSLAPWPIKFFRALRWKLRVRRAAPLRFVPVPKGMPRGTAVALGVIGVILGGGLLLYLTPGMAKVGLLGAEPLPVERQSMLLRLEEARNGYFRTPIERLLTWYDLDHHVEPVTPPPSNPAVHLAAVQNQTVLPPVQYPDLGFQVLRSKEALALAPCGLTGLDYSMVLPLAPLVEPVYRFFAGACDPLGRLARLDADYGIEDLVRVPVIQNDFIGTYIIARFGLGAGLATLCLQGLVLVALLALAIKLYPPAEIDDGSAAVGRFLSIVMVGAAAILGCQWLIAWGNCLGLLPVMGQPMTFAAAATSHHLFLGLPILTLAAVAMRVAQYRPVRISRAPPG